MVHSQTFYYELGSGFDPVELCHMKLQEVSNHKIPRSQGTGAYNAAYGGLAGGKFKTYEYPCHRKMENLSGVTHVYNRFTKNPSLSETARKRYLEWLLSDDSPWKTFKNRRETLLPKDFQGTSGEATGRDLQSLKQDYIYHYGWVWDSFDSPANLQHNFLVAQRMAVEWPRTISKWHVRTKLGCDPSTTFLMLDILKPVSGRRDKNNQVLFQINHQIQYDWPLNIALSDERYAWNFIHGRVDETKLIQPFKDSPRYYPVNEIFGPYAKDVKDSYPCKIFSLYNRDSGSIKRLGLTEEEARETHKGRTGFSKFSYDKYWSVSEREVIEIINLENERLRSI